MPFQQTTNANYEKEPSAEPPRARVRMWQAWKNMLKNWHFAGRASRQEYWLNYLCNFIIIAVSAIAGIIMLTMGAPAAIGVGIFIALGLYTLYIIIPSLCLTVRRLHDQGKSGWWWWISFVPSVGGLILFILTVLPAKNTPDNPWHKD